MAKFLRQILDAKEPLFSQAIRSLENMTGKKGVDVAYAADIMSRAHHSMRQMGLDPSDTLAVELYRALVSQPSNSSLLHDTDDVALIIEGHVVSFNRDDIAENTHKTFEMRTSRHARCQVEHGLMARYVAADGDNEIAIEETIAQAGMSVCDLSDYHEQRTGRLSEQKSMPMMLCIGDIFTDAFIKLSEDVAHVDVAGDGMKWLNIPFGGRPPYEEVEIVESVGPAPNAAVSAARLGVATQLMSWLGDDKAGVDSLKHLAAEGVGTKLVVQKKHAKSNYYYVLRLGAERTILTKDEAYDYTWHQPSTVPDWVYLASISGESWPLHKALAGYLEDNPTIRFVLQPGTFHFEWGAKKMSALYRRAELVILNREEAVMVTGKHIDKLRDLANGIHELGAKKVVITDGPNGSYASYEGKLVSMPNYPDPAPPYDRTGAGDAFASTIVAALALGESMETALLWAPINSMSVVQKLGAQAGLLNRHQVEQLLESAPVEYEVKEYTR
jgi:sugar/nucleoside kinase (ribokinase family)